MRRTMKPSVLALPGSLSGRRCSPRGVEVRADDLTMAQAWSAALAAEGLPSQLSGIDDMAPVAADAVVLCISSHLTEQLARLRSLRAQAPLRPLLVALRDLRDLDHVLALEMGADDAFDTALAAPVVAARLRALWRRLAPAEPTDPPQALHFGALELLQLPRQARLDHHLLPLTDGEFEVLWLLASRAGQAVSRREILRRVRGLDDHPMDRSIDSRVYRIRAKLGDHGRAAQRIRTVRNHGYAFSPAGW